MKNIHLNIAIPSNVLEDCSDLRSKTQKIGQIARAAAIFKVEKIIIYHVNKLINRKFSGDRELIKGILEYLDCPQYLRKKVFPKVPSFKYIGTLHPLRTPHHPLENKIAKLETISIREGLVLFSNQHFSEIDLGLEKSIKIAIPHLPKDQRIILKLERQGNLITGTPVTKNNTKVYWGFEVEILNESIKDFLKKFSNNLIIATSKRGSPINSETQVELLQKLEKKNNLLVLFGSPATGLFEIFTNNNLRLADWVDFILNFIPQQGTETIRVEEALFSTLALINSLLAL